MIGKILGDRYEILEEIGNGGMAIVYKAKCLKLNRIVAIKVLKDEYKSDEEFVRKFNRESQAAASLSHPNIVSVFDVGNDNGVYYIVMELVEGITLKQYIKENQKMNWRTALKFSMQICSALAHAHRNNIIHRDIKPLNIIISKDENCKVTDFGIACVGNLNETKKIDEGILGSVHYISPEHAKGVLTDERSDIYSLGVTMYEMLTGVLPFDGENAVAVAVMHIKSEPQPIKDINIAVPLTFVQIVKKAMTKDIGLRYQSANEMYNDLKELSNEPDLFIIEKDPVPEDLYKTIIVSKEEKEEIKKQIEDEVIEDLDVTEENEESVENVENLERVRNRRKKRRKIKLKSYITNLFKAETKKDKVAIIAALVVSLFMIGAVIAIGINVLVPGGINFASKNEYVIPKFIGDNIDAAREQYKDLKIEFIIDQEEYNNDYEAGLITSQNPPEGMKVKLPIKVHLTVSKGARQLVLSSYINKEARQAELEINEQGLKYIEIQEYSDTVPIGYVMSHYPQAGTTVLSGSDVTVTVSKGVNEEFTVVPKLIGLTEAEAKAKLTECDLVLGGIIRETSFEAEGKVIGQSAPEGSELVTKSKITLTLSSGSKQNIPSGNQSSDSSNKVPVDTSPSVPSDTPSTTPSETPVNTPSETPTEKPSETPSDNSSEIPEATQDASSSETTGDSSQTQE